MQYWGMTSTDWWLDCMIGSKIACRLFDCLLPRKCSFYQLIAWYLDCLFDCWTACMIACVITCFISLPGVKGSTAKNSRILMSVLMAAHMEKTLRDVPVITKWLINCWFIDWWLDCLFGCITVCNCLISDCLIILLFI